MIIRLQCADISILGRITSGVKLINLKEGVTVASVAKVREKEEEASEDKQAEDPGESAEEDIISEEVQPDSDTEGELE